MSLLTLGKSLSSKAMLEGGAVLEITKASIWAIFAEWETKFLHISMIQAAIPERLSCHHRYGRLASPDCAAL